MLLTCLSSSRPCPAGSTYPADATQSALDNALADERVASLEGEDLGHMRSLEAVKELDSPYPMTCGVVGMSRANVV